MRNSKSFLVLIEKRNEGALLIEEATKTDDTIIRVNPRVNNDTDVEFTFV